jgi:nicotinate-nucleotide adenylyltransferase
MKLGLLGGSFDPIHIGHLRLAIEALEHLGLDEVVFEVANVSPFKSESPPTDGAHRLRMVELAAAGTPGLRAGTRELERPPPSYAVDTVESYIADGNEVTLICGADALIGLDRWKEPDRLFSVCRMAVAARPGYDVPIPERWAAAISTFDMPLIEVSSTDVRRRIRAGLSVAHLLPDSVIRFISEERLYR